MDGAVKSALAKHASMQQPSRSLPGHVQHQEQHQEQFPLLAFLVRVVFAVPAASSKSERVFSVAGLVVSALMSRLIHAKWKTL